MWFVISKKKHQEALNEWGFEEHFWNEVIGELNFKIEEKDKVLKSSEREKVLDDLQSALHLIQDYQRSLSIVCAADPHYTKADALLDKYGLQGDSQKIVGGLQTTPHKPTIIGVDYHGKAVGMVGNEGVTTRVGTEQELRTQTREDEQVFGDQSYGQEKATLMAERTDDGDRLFFVPKDEVDPPALVSAKATTEYAGFPEPDTID
jgi:hypothetical protein